MPGRCSSIPVFTRMRASTGAVGGGTRSVCRAHGYVGQHLPPLSQMQLLEFRRIGKRDGPFARSIDLSGDGTIRLIFTPGHTRGHQSVLLRLADSRTVLIVGDAAYTVRSIREQLLPMRPPTTEPRSGRCTSLTRLRASTPMHCPSPTHDPDAWRAIAKDPTGS